MARSYDSARKFFSEVKSMDHMKHGEAGEGASMVTLQLSIRIM